MPKFKPKQRLTDKQCPRCKTDDKNKWTKNGYRYSTYCRECQKYYNKKKSAKIYEKINKATNNGKCWWLHQSIVAELNSRGGR
jgi:Zn ribbon nucleic-acid-binding protein